MPLAFTDNESTSVQELVGATGQQAITWAKVDAFVCRQMASLGHNELTFCL